MKDKLLKDLGLAYRAGKIILGGDIILEGFNKMAISCVFLVVGNTGDTARKLKNKCAYYKIPLIDSLTKEDIKIALGKDDVKAFALCDKGFYDLIFKLL